MSAQPEPASQIPLSLLLTFAPGSFPASVLQHKAPTQYLAKHGKTKAPEDQIISSEQNQEVQQSWAHGCQ
jgi:hypothetical protein